MDVSRLILKRVTGMFKIEPIRKIATEVSRNLFEKTKIVFMAWFVTDRAYSAVKCGHGLQKR
jgi:hypothetical protein